MSIVACFIALFVTLTPAVALADGIPIYRMYNTQTSEHLYTSSVAEYESCGSGAYRDWNREGVGWFAPEDGAPVYRLYNPGLGDHHYTVSASERDMLINNAGWVDEGVCWRSDNQSRVPLYRVYNGRLTAGQHHYTTNAGERDWLVANAGWSDEQVGWYGVSEGVPLPPSSNSGSSGSSSSQGGQSGSGSQVGGSSPSDTVLITRTGSTYHRLEGCRSTNRAGVVTTQVSLVEAQRRGLTPCKNCYH